MDKRASMSDVALAAGVSISTASRALRGVGRISAETRARVVETAARLQFEPDMIARSFVTGKSYIVGVLAEQALGRFSMPIIMGATNHLGRENIAAVVLDAQGNFYKQFEGNSWTAEELAQAIREAAVSHPR